jgi:hypothetical protein
LAEGIALGAVLALLAVIALLLAHGVQQDTVPASIGEQLIGVCGTMAAAWFAVWGIGWQIRAGREAEERNRVTALYAARITLTDALSTISLTLVQMKDRLLFESTLPDGAFETQISTIRSERGALSNTALHADPEDAFALAKLSGSLQVLCARAHGAIDRNDRTELVAMAVVLYDIVNDFYQFSRANSESIEIKPSISVYITISGKDRDKIDYPSNKDLLYFTDFKSIDFLCQHWRTTFLSHAATTPTERPLT